MSGSRSVGTSHASGFPHPGRHVVRPQARSEAFVQDGVIAISLGEVTDKQVATITEALGEIPARMMLSPNGWRADESSAA